MEVNMAGEALIGSRENPIVRPLTKNFVEAADKSFKTTFLLRLALGMSEGTSVYPSLPVPAPRRVLYLHGELAPSELKERLEEAAIGLHRPLDQFFQGRSLEASLVTPEGQQVISELVGQYRPEVLVIDPWQSFIASADENSFKEVSCATNFMDKLISGSQLTIFLAIHFGKDPGKGARGHSMLGGWRDTKFTLKRSNCTLTVKIEPRWTHPPDPITLTFKEGTLWEGKPPKWTKQAEKIRELVRVSGGKTTKEAVGTRLNLSPGSLRMALKRAVDDGAVTREGNLLRLPA